MGYVNSGSFFTQSLYHIFAAEVRRNMIIYVDDVFVMHKDAVSYTHLTLPTIYSV